MFWFEFLYCKSTSPSYLRQQAKEKIKKYIDEQLPEEYEKCLAGLNAITRERARGIRNISNNNYHIQKS